MRRIAILATCLIAILGFTQPAIADSVVTIKSIYTDDSTPDAPGIDGTPCGGTDIVDTLNDWYLDITSTPIDPNLSGVTRSWDIGFTDTLSQANAYGAQIFPNSASELQTFKIDVNGSASGQASIYAWNSGTVWVGKASVTAPGPGWSTVSAAGLTYAWNDYSLDAQGNPTLLGSVTTVNATPADFESAHGVPAYGYSAEIGFGCDNLPFSFQNLQYGAPGSVITENFSSLADHLEIGRSASKVIAGTGVKITGGSKFGYLSSIRLQARALTSSTWTTIATVPIGAFHCTGTTTRICWFPFSKVVYPKVSSAYRWVDPGNQATDPGASSATTVSVATRITATWPAIYRGRTFAVNGTTYPAKPGSVVTLYGKHGTTVYVLGHATVTRTGTFRVLGTVRASGSWSFWITIPAKTGDLAGKSAIRSVYVR